MNTLLKTCYHCSSTKDQTLFKKDYKKQNNNAVKYTNLCLNCDKIIYKEWRTNPKNKERYNKGFRTRRFARKQRAIEYKGGKCSYCGIVVHPAAFDFHHLDKTQKDIDPGLLMTSSDAKLFVELDKCILLCANCHRLEHFKNGY